MYEGVVQDLIDELGRLPGVGPKSAQRIAFHVLQADPVDVRRLAHALLEVKDKVRFCAVCGNVAEAEKCRVCLDPRRDLAVICVVEESKDVVAIERTREFRGRYHVLGGAISPIEGVGPDDLRIRELLARLADGTVTELILATDPNLEGEATATYLARLCKPMGLKVTRLASGLPVGGDLEYADEVTLGRAFEGDDCSMSDRTINQQPHAPHQAGPEEERDTAQVPHPPHTHAHGSEPDDFAVQIADSVESFVLSVTEVAKGDEPGSAVSSSCWRSRNCCWPAAGWAPSRTSSPRTGSSPTPVRSRTPSSCGSGWPCCSRRSTSTTRSSTRTGRRRSRARSGSRTTWPGW